MDKQDKKQEIPEDIHIALVALLKILSSPTIKSNLSFKTIVTLYNYITLINNYFKLDVDIQ